ncbi:MAG: hypothetical protein V1778_00010 [bacterium]
MVAYTFLILIAFVAIALPIFLESRLSLMAGCKIVVGISVTIGCLLCFRYLFVPSVYYVQTERSSDTYLHIHREEFRNGQPEFRYVYGGVLWQLFGLRSKLLQPCGSWRVERTRIRKCALSKSIRTFILENVRVRIYDDLNFVHGGWCIEHVLRYVSEYESASAEMQEQTRQNGLLLAVGGTLLALKMMRPGRHTPSATRKFLAAGLDLLPKEAGRFMPEWEKDAELRLPIILARTNQV